MFGEKPARDGVQCPVVPLRRDVDLRETGAGTRLVSGVQHGQRQVSEQSLPGRPVGGGHAAGRAVDTYGDGLMQMYLLRLGPHGPQSSQLRSATPFRNLDHTKTMWMRAAVSKTAATPEMPVPAQPGGRRVRA